MTNDPSKIEHAVRWLRDALNEGANIDDSLGETESEFGFTPDVLRSRFERGYGYTLEEFANRKFNYSDDAFFIRLGDLNGLSVAPSEKLGRLFDFEGESFHFIKWCGQFVAAMSEADKSYVEIWGSDSVNQIVRMMREK